MKYLIALVLGIAAGAGIAVALLYFNPFTSNASLSPLSISDGQQYILNYSAVPEDAIVYTNDGESQIDPHPEKVLQLWEPPIRQTEALITTLRDARGISAGLGIKFSSNSERTRILNGEALIDSTWYIYLPERGSLLVSQQENYWDYLRDVVVPARMSSGDNWKGNWHGRITNGPGPLGTARVHGGSGTFEGLEFEAIETLSAKAYSAEIGPVVLDGQLTIELQARSEETATAANGE